MSNELSDLILIIDSREKEQKRINSMRGFFEEKEAVVEIAKLGLIRERKGLQTGI